VGSRSGVTIKGWGPGKTRVLKRIGGQVRKRMPAVGKLLVAEAQRRVAVRSGLLKKNIAYHITRSGQGPSIEFTLWLGVKRPAYHGALVEYGTVKMAAQPFLRPAIYDNARKIVHMLCEEGDK